MKALVLGGSGHVGAALTRELLARGHGVTATGRRARPAALEGLPVAYHRGDDRHPGTLGRWARGADLIFDAAAPYPLEAFAGGDAVVERARRRTRELLAAARGIPLGCVGSFVTRVEPARGPSGWAAGAGRLLHPYFRVKEAVEELLVEAAASGAPVAGVHPATCLGPWDSRPASEALLPRLVRGEVAFVAADRVGIVDVRDVAAALVNAVEAERFGRPHLLVGHRVEVAEVARRACAIAGVRPPTLRLPAAWTVGPAWWLEATLTAWGCRSAGSALVPLLVAAQAGLPERGDEAALGVEPRSLDRTLADAMAWYGEHPAASR
ncbi:MAG: NAD-dependent epimerase/dehydratase family protein [Thermoanaerobaculia bacterium]